MGLGPCTREGEESAQDDYTFFCYYQFDNELLGRDQVYIAYKMGPRIFPQPIGCRVDF